MRASTQKNRTQAGKKVQTQHFRKQKLIFVNETIPILVSLWKEYQETCPDAAKTTDGLDHVIDRFKYEYIPHYTLDIQNFKEIASMWMVFECTSISLYNLFIYNIYKSIFWESLV